MKAIQLKLGEKVADVVSHYNSFAMVVAAALGDGKDKGPRKPGVDGVIDLTAGAGSVEEAVAAINRGMRI
jgi:hypothetical protein